MEIFIISIVFVLFVTGYKVFSDDQIQYLLLPYRKIFDNFCPNDWFVWHTTHYHVFFDFFVRFIYVATFGNLELGIFIVWFILTTMLLHGIYFITLSCRGTYKDYLAVVVLIIFYSSTSLGNSCIYTNYLLPTSISFVLMLYSLSYLISSKLKLAFFFLGLASLVHINYGILGLPLYTLFLILNMRTINIKTVIICYGLFFIFFLPTLIPTIINFGFYDNTEGLKLAYKVRSPHHYYPLAFEKKTWIISGTPVVISMLLLLKNKADRYLVTIISLMLMMISFGGFMSCIDGPLFFTKIYVWRFMPLVLLLSYVAIAKWLCSIEKLNFSNIALIIALGLLFYYRSFFLGPIFGLGYSVLIIWALLSILFISAYLNEFVLTIFIIIFLVLCTGTIRGELYPVIRTMDIFNKDEAMYWIKHNTENSALFMIPPNLGELRINAHRSVIVDFKCAPIGIGNEMKEWKTRLETITNSKSLESYPEKGVALSKKLKELYLNNSLQYVAKVMKHYNAAYFITYSNHKNIESFIHSKNFDFIHRINDIFIFKIKSDVENN